MSPAQVKLSRYIIRFKIFAVTANFCRTTRRLKDSQKALSMPAKIVPVTEYLSVASQIAPDDIQAIADGGYRTIINNRPDGEEPGQPAADEAKRQAESLGLDYFYLPVTAATLTPARIDEFEGLLNSARGPVLAHCRSGTRCYLLWAAVQLKNGGASAGELIERGNDLGFEISALRRFS